VAQAERARDCRTPRDDTWTSGRAFDRVPDGMGRGGRRHPEVARCAAAALGRAGRSISALVAELDDECARLVTNGLLRDPGPAKTVYAPASERVPKPPLPEDEKLIEQRKDDAP